METARNNKMLELEYMSFYAKQKDAYNEGKEDGLEEGLESGLKAGLFAMVKALKPVLKDFDMVYIRSKTKMASHTFMKTFFWGIINPKSQNLNASVLDILTQKPEQCCQIACVAGTGKILRQNLKKSRLLRNQRY